MRVVFLPLVDSDKTSIRYMDLLFSGFGIELVPENKEKWRSGTPNAPFAAKSLDAKFNLKM